jgi:hypothetical protein
LMPVAAATPGAVVLAPKRATGARMLLGEGVRVALAARRDVGKLRYSCMIEDVDPISAGKGTVLLPGNAVAD